MPPRRRVTRAALPTLTLAALALCACDHAATVTPNSRHLLSAHVVDMVPGVVGGDGTWAPACGAEPADGLLLRTVLTAAGGSSTPDPDRSIQPGDVVEFRVVEGPSYQDVVVEAGGLDVSVDCLGSASDPADCSDPGGATLSSIRHIPRGLGRAGGRDIVLALDRSASLTGLVDATTWLEDPDGGVTGDFGALASDLYDARLVAARHFVQTLSEADRVAVLTFGALVGAPIVGCPDCVGAQAFANPTDAAARLDGLDDAPAGRSNLWTAVATAQELLSTLPAADRTRHVVVLTDGPDTCTGDDAIPCSVACPGVVTRADVLASASAAEVHFVQFESPGYPGRDPRQMEVACATGGHYQFVDSLALDDVTALGEALQAAMQGVRLALAGYWQLAVSVPSWRDIAGGELYAISGEVHVLPASRLTTETRSFAFGPGAGGIGVTPEAWDRRPAARLPCVAAAECEGTCSPDTALCVAVSEAASCP